MSEPSITRGRGSRSAHTPPTSRNRTTGTIRAARTRPRSDADPVRSSTANEIATGRRPSPRYDVAWPTKNSRNCRSWSTPRLGRLNTGVSCTGGRREEHQSRDPLRIRAVRDRGTCLLGHEDRLRRGALAPRARGTRAVRARVGHAARAACASTAADALPDPARARPLRTSSARARGGGAHVARRPLRRGRLREHRARLRHGGRGGRRRYRVPVNTALLEETLASEPAYRARQ